MDDLILMVSLVALVVACISMVLAVYTYLSLGKVRRVITYIASSRSLKRLQELIERKRRLRSRYIIFRVLPLCSNYSINREVVEEGIVNKFKELFGLVNLRRAGISVIYFDEGKLIGVVRVKHVFRMQLLTALGLVKELSGCGIIIVPIRTTGTLKRARKYIRYLIKS
ncbi:MAG TPA: hypothetical protein ENF75_03335 [Acidilobales archaeon]|nr:hypothetical protein [Acidilobales archaeon]